MTKNPSCPRRDEIPLSMGRQMPRGRTRRYSSRSPCMALVGMGLIRGLTPCSSKDQFGDSNCLRDSPGRLLQNSLSPPTALWRDDMLAPPLRSACMRRKSRSSRDARSSNRTAGWMRRASRRSSSSSTPRCVRTHDLPSAREVALNRPDHRAVHDDGGGVRRQSIRGKSKRKEARKPKGEQAHHAPTTAGPVVLKLRRRSPSPRTAPGAGGPPLVSRSCRRPGSHITDPSSCRCRSRRDRSRPRACRRGGP